jgi:hypothetical protein
MLNHEKLLAAMNALNSPPEPFTLDNVKLSLPQPHAGDNAWNTKITVTAKPGRGYSSSIDFYYHRIDLAEYGLLEIESPQSFTMDGILVVLNNINERPENEKANIAELDLVPVTLPAFAPNGDAHSIILTADRNSLGWTGTAPILLAYNLPDVTDLFQYMTETLPEPGYLP